MTLEQEIRKEIDSWDVTLFRPGYRDVEVGYQDIIKPLLYGIGIGVTEKIINEINTTTVTQEQFLNMSYLKAVEKFKRTYLLRNLEQHNYSCIETAEVILETEKTLDTSRSALAHILRRTFGMSVDALQESQQEKTVQDIESDELVYKAEKDIQRYTRLINPTSMFYRFLNKNSQALARRFVQLGINSAPGTYNWELFDLKYHNAMKQFRMWYLTEQIKRHGSATKAAEPAGMSVDSFRQATHALRIKVLEVLKSV